MSKLGPLINDPNVDYSFVVVVVVAVVVCLFQ